MFKNACLGLLVVYLHLFLASEAWWDEGHMVIAAVAAQGLGKHQTNVLQTILGSWNETYPGMASLPVAATWPDHVKCTSDYHEFCQGLTHLDSLEIFNTWHYSSIVFNPHDVKVPEWQQNLPDHAGAYWALEHLFTSMTGRPSNPLFATRLSKDDAPLASTDLPDSTNTTIVDDYATSHHHHHRPHHPRGSVLSWNLQLRLLIHIFGDLHQPLHAVETFTHALPHGDAGGSKVHVDVGDPSIRSLHAFLDSCGGVCNHSWPHFTVEEVNDLAKKLVAKYPKTMFEKRLSGDLEGTDFRALAHESKSIAVSAVYNPELLAHLSVPVKEPFRPSNAYVEEVQGAMIIQLMVAGYRLTNVLQQIMAPASRFLNGEISNEVSPTIRQTALGSIAGAIGLSSANLGRLERKTRAPAMSEALEGNTVEDIVGSRCHEEIENNIFFRQSLVVSTVLLGVSMLFNIAAAFSYFHSKIRAEQSQAIPQSSRVTGFFSSVKDASADLNTVRHGAGYLRVGYEMPLMNRHPAEGNSAMIPANGSVVATGRSYEQHDVWNLQNKFAPDHQLCSSCSVQKRQFMPGPMRKGVFGVVPADHPPLRPATFDKTWLMHRPDPPPYDYLADA